MGVRVFASGEFCNQVRHCHFNIQLHHVGDWMKLYVYDLVGQRHETDKHRLLNSLS